MSITLSKTDYILFRECRKNAWFKIHKPEIYYKSELSEFEKALIKTGNEVELAVRQLFPNGILIEGRDEKSQKETQNYIARGEEILFQPIFARDNFLAALDVLKFNAGSKTYSVYEIKSSNSVDDNVHYHELAFQVNLLKKFGCKVESANLIHLNSEYVRSGELNIKNLFKIEDITAEVESVSDSVLKEIDEALKYLAAEKEPSGYCCCIYKGRSAHCTTFKHSNPQVPDYGVHDLSRIGNSKSKLKEMVDSGVFHIKDIPEHIKLSDIQKNQIDAHVFNKILVDKNQIASELEKLSFPLYFLDYETFPCAIPRFDGFSPYQQIPFQYSLHILEVPEKELKHRDFLYTKPDDPSRSFVESLLKDIGDTGSVIIWSKGLEIPVNKKLSDRLPEFKSFLDSLNSRIYDLEEIFKKQLYVHKDFKGKTSIKKVSPVLVPELSYQNLNIHDGGVASQKWDEITKSTDQEAQRKIIRDLKEYCGLDTYNMFAIWKSLCGILKVSV